MVMSLVLNDDVVPRMSSQSIEALADQVKLSHVGMLHLLEIRNRHGVHYLKTNRHF